MSTTNPIQVQALLRDVARAGVYHLPQTEREELIAAAESCGYFVFFVNLAKVQDKSGLLDVIARDMAFPEWFGSNLDALADCLGDLGWRPAEGYLVLLEHCDAINVGARDEFIAVLNAFEAAANEWREQSIPLWCLVDMRADGIAWLPEF